MTSQLNKNSVRLVNSTTDAQVNILFLGYDENHTSLIAQLISKKCKVWHSQEKITSTNEYDFVISFGYRHIIKRELIENSKAPIINLHISYLPWNRGAHPNFWAFFDNTPSGVSIHLLDHGIDTGPILFQKKINFGEQEKTFAQTYKKLVFEIETLFLEHIDEIISGALVPIPQVGKGTFHKAADLPKEFSGWNSDIKTEINRLSKLLLRTNLTK